VDASLEVAIRARAPITEEHVVAVTRAITTWNSVLGECLNGQVSMTYVPGARADIVLDLTSRPVFGVARGAGTLCRPAGCKIIMSTEPPPGSPFLPLTPEETYRFALHELGHASGLGHATDLASNDLMGYGGLFEGTNYVISRCDADALAYIWAWVLDGTESAQPTEPDF
jgi:hypothetical protein